MQPSVEFFSIRLYVVKMEIEPIPSAKKGKATELSQKIANKLVELREQFNMSQRDFAERIGVSFQQYQKYEKGKDRLSMERAVLLCSALGLSLNIFGDDKPVYGFAETEQAGFGSSSLSTAEQELLDIYASVPKKNKENFLNTVRQLAKMA